ncbi:hypothetical protein VQ01_14845 [Tamlana sp. s12]|nr:hypothetical protein VQ01_14845 [Tamlana sp. s12]
MFFSMAYSQQKIIKTIVNQETLLPVAHADVVSNDGYTIANSEGKFELFTDSKKIKIRRIGYEDYEILIEKLKKVDSIFLKEKHMELPEVILSNTMLINTYLDSTIGKFPKTKHSENFFLRATLKKNNELVKLIDISGQLERQKTFSSKKDYKKNFSFEIKNIRKAGILDQSKNTLDFEMFSLSELCYRINFFIYRPKYFNYEYESYIDEHILKVNFAPKDGKKTFSGHYLIDTASTTIIKAHITSTTISEFTKKNKNKWRTVGWHLDTRLEHENSQKNMHVRHAILTFDVEYINKLGETDLYHIKYDIYFDKKLNETRVSENIKANKDMFTLDHDYNEEFWKNQNQLPLTKEMVDFINSQDTLNQNEFRSNTNIK